jgi:uncharacterized OB-fold protein
MSEAKKAAKPVPRPNAYVDTKPFWEAANSGRLKLQYCRDTGKFQHYPRPVSIYTGKRNLEWREVSGKGKVYAYTVTRVPMPGFESQAPYIVATIELDEGVRILCNLMNCEIDAVRIGMRVKLCWERLSDDINQPAFEPDGAAR